MTTTWEVGSTVRRLIDGVAFETKILLRGDPEHTRRLGRLRYVDDGRLEDGVPISELEQIDTLPPIVSLRIQAPVSPREDPLADFFNDRISQDADEAFAMWVRQVTSGREPNNVRRNGPRSKVVPWQVRYDALVRRERALVDGEAGAHKATSFGSFLSDDIKSLSAAVSPLPNSTWASLAAPGSPYSTRLALRPSAISDYNRHFASTKAVAEATAAVQVSGGLESSKRSSGTGVPDEVAAWHKYAYMAAQRDLAAFSESEIESINDSAPGLLLQAAGGIIGVSGLASKKVAATHEVALEETLDFLQQCLRSDTSGPKPIDICYEEAPKRRRRKANKKLSALELVSLARKYGIPVKRVGGGYSVSYEDRARVQQMLDNEVKNAKAAALARRVRAVLLIQRLAQRWIQQRQRDLEKSQRKRNEALLRMALELVCGAERSVGKTSPTLAILSLFGCVDFVNVLIPRLLEREKIGYSAGIFFPPIDNPFRTITVLNLRGCCLGIQTSTVVAIVTHLAATLKHLDLSGPGPASPVGDGELLLLAGLHQLVSLELCCWRRVTDSGVIAWANSLGFDAAADKDACHGKTISVKEVAQSMESLRLPNLLPPAKSSNLPDIGGGGILPRANAGVSQSGGRYRKPPSRLRGLNLTEVRSCVGGVVGEQNRTQINRLRILGRRGSES